MPEHYPSAWPKSPGKGMPLGLAQATSDILAKARRRKDEIGEELCRANAGKLSNYPANCVREILLAWGVAVPLLNNSELRS